MHVHELHTHCLTAVFRTYHNYTAHKTTIGPREVAPFFEVFISDSAYLVHFTSVFDGAIVCPHFIDLVWHLFLDTHVHMEDFAGKIFIHEHTGSF